MRICRRSWKLEVGRLSGVNAKLDDDGVVTMTVTLEISSTAEMDKVFNKFRMIDGLIDCYRAKN